MDGWIDSSIEHYIILFTSTFYLLDASCFDLFAEFSITCLSLEVFKEKMKHLLYEHENTMSELKADGLVTTEAMQKEQEKLEANLHMEKEARIVDLQEVDNEKLAMELEQVCNLTPCCLNLSTFSSRSYIKAAF